jgi:hypothetical protein
VTTGVSVQVSGLKVAISSYETTHSWNSEPQNIESAGGGNDEVWNRCAQSFFINNNDRIPYFDIRYFLFDIRYSFFSEFISRLDWTLAARGGAYMKLHLQNYVRPSKSRLKTAPTIYKRAINP